MVFVLLDQPDRSSVPVAITFDFTGALGPNVHRRWLRHSADRFTIDGDPTVNRRIGTRAPKSGSDVSITLNVGGQTIAFVE